MPEKEVKDIFDDSPKSNNLIFELYKKYGLDCDDLGESGVLHDFGVIPYAEAEAWVLQNAFNRGLSTTETIRLLLEGRMRIEEMMKEKKKQESTS